MNDFESDGFFRRNAIWLVVLAALVVFGFLLFKGWDQIVNEEIDGMVTITGNFSCLPLAPESKLAGDTCVLGVRSRDNLYFALDVSRIQDANTDLKAEDTIAVTGTLKEDAESLAEWSDYRVAGVVKVNTLLRTR